MDRREPLARDELRAGLPLLPVPADAERVPGPGEKDLSLKDLIAATDDGVLVTGNGSWSIDHQRYNFQFGGQMFHEIKKGRIVGPLRDVAYQANSVDFWNSLDLLGGQKEWRLGGSLNDGKGEPSQSNAVSHGCPPARFRQINILNTDERKRIGHGV